MRAVHCCANANCDCSLESTESLLEFHANANNGGHVCVDPWTSSQSAQEVAVDFENEHLKMMWARVEQARLRISLASLGARLIRRLRGGCRAWRAMLLFPLLLHLVLGERIEHEDLRRHVSSRHQSSPPYDRCLDVCMHAPFEQVVHSPRSFRP